MKHYSYCDDIISSITHRGWSCDDHCEEIARGCVKVADGGWIIGVAYSRADDIVWRDEVYSDQEEAARMADECARVGAESEQERNWRFDAMLQAEVNVKGVKHQLAVAWALRRHPTLGDINAVHELIDALRDAREVLAQATRDYEG